MAQDNSGDKPKQSKLIASDIPLSLSNVPGLGNSATPTGRSKLERPVWKEWSLIPVVRLHEACALSMDIDPHSVKEHWPRGWEPPTYDDEVKAEFLLRLRILKANWDGHFFRACGALESVYLSDFAQWAVNVAHWKNMPPELVAMSQKQVKPADTAATHVESDAEPIDAAPTESKPQNEAIDMQVKQQSKSVPLPGVSAAVIIEKFRLGEEWKEKLRKAPSGKYAYLKDTWTLRGKKGKGGCVTMFSPTQIGLALLRKRVKNRVSIETTIQQQFPNFADEWDELVLKGKVP